MGTPTVSAMGSNTELDNVVAIMSLSPTTNVNVPFRFLDLPSEIRVDIYERLLIVGKVYYVPEWLAESYGVHEWLALARPAVGILRVCKQTRKEAEKMYTTKNTFVFPYAIYGRPVYHSLPASKQFLFETAGANCIQSLSVAFHHWPDCAWPVVVEKPPVYAEGDQMPSHDEYYTGQYKKNNDNWLALISTLKKMPRPLKKLELDFTRAHCQCRGDCPMSIHMNVDFMATVLPERVQILGLKASEEQEVTKKLKSAFGCEKLDDCLEIQFDPLEDVVAKMKVAELG